MAGMPIRRARRNAQLSEEAMMEINQDLEADYQAHAEKRERAAALYERALRMDLDPLASADDIRRANIIMSRLEKDYGFRFSDFVNILR